MTIRLNRRTFIASGAAAAGSTLLGAPAISEASWPNKPVRVVCAFPPGGSTDVVSRSYSEFLSRHFGQSFIVENKGGGSGTVGALDVKQAKPDGLPVYLVPSPLLTIMPMTYKSPGYDAEKDLAPVATVVDIPTAVVTGAQQPYNDLKQSVAWAKNKPGKAAVGLATIGSSGHLGAFALANNQKFELIPTPYRGAAPAGEEGPSVGM